MEANVRSQKEEKGNQGFCLEKEKKERKKKKRKRLKKMSLEPSSYTLKGNKIMKFPLYPYVHTGYYNSYQLSAIA